MCYLKTYQTNEYLPVFIFFLRVLFWLPRILQVSLYTNLHPLRQFADTSCVIKCMHVCEFREHILILLMATKDRAIFRPPGLSSRILLNYAIFPSIAIVVTYLSTAPQQGWVVPQTLHHTALITLLVIPSILVIHHHFEHP